MRIPFFLPVVLALLAPGGTDCQSVLRAQGPKPDNQVRTDRYGDALPAGAVARMGTLRLRQGEWFRSLALSGDGKTVAGGDEASICLWEVATGRLLHRFATTRRASFPSVLFSADDRVLFALENSRPAVLRRWETATGKELAPRLFAEPHSQGGGLVALVALTPDGNGLVGKGDRTIHLWDAVTGKQLRSFQGPKERVNYVALSPDGKTLAATGYATSFKLSTAVYLWDVATGNALPALDGHEEGAQCVAFAPDGRTLVAADAKHNYRWELPTGKLPGGKLPGGKLLGRFAREAIVANKTGQAPAAFSPDGTILVAEDFGADNLWEVDSGKRLRQLERPRQADGTTIAGYGFAFSADGKVLAKRCYNLCNLILLWDTATGKLLHRFEAHAHAIEQVVVAPDGRTLASRAFREPEFRLWDVSTGKPLQTFGSWSAGLVFAPDGETLISAGDSLSAWDTATGKELPRFKSPAKAYFASLAASAEGRTLVAGDRRGRASFWDVSTGKALRQHQMHPVHVDEDGDASASAVIPLALSPDGRALIFGNDYDQITIASAATGKRLHQFRSRCTLRALALSPDGKTLASTGPSNAQVIHLWETATGKERLQIGDKRDSFYSVVFSADGKTLISGGQKTIRFWDTATGKEVGQLPGHHGPVTALALLRDGQGFVSGSADTTILVWRSIVRKAENPPAMKLTGLEMEALWVDLVGDDAGKTYRAIHRLAASAAYALPFLRPRLAPVPTPDPRQLDQLIADLDSADFRLRQRANETLDKLGELAGPALRKVADDKQPSLEMQRRIDRLLTKIEDLAMSAETLRAWRVLETLEAIGNPESRQILQTLAGGAAGARITEGAADAVKRLGRPAHLRP